MPRDFQEHETGSGITVELPKDTRVFRRTKAGSNAVYFSNQWLRAGEEIQVGGSQDVYRFDYNHGWHDFVAWLDAPDEAEAEGICYIMTSDLPQSW